MKTLLSALTLCLTTAALQAGAVPAALEAHVAPHPTVLKVQYKKEWLPVAKIIKTDPVVLVQGKEHRLRQEPLYDTQRVGAFGPGKLHLEEVKLGGVQIHYNSADFHGEPQVGQHGGLAELTARVTSSRPIDGGFVAVVVYSPLIFVRDHPWDRPQIVVRPLPTLPADTEVALKITSKMFLYVPGQRYFMHFFDDQGREVLTNFSKQAWVYYALKEAQQLDTALADYLERYAGRDVPATPVVVIKPVIPEGTPLPPESPTAQLRVTAKGRVEQITLTGVSDPNLEKSLREALGGWLFFPRLKAGQPVSSRVEIPLEL